MTEVTAKVEPMKMAPCPFCRESEELALHNRQEDEGLYHWATCYTCGGEGPKRREAADAVRAWNQRDLRPDDALLRTALAGMLKMADSVRALAEEFAPMMPSPTLWGDDVRAFTAAIDVARAALNERNPDHDK